MDEAVAQTYRECMKKMLGWICFDKNGGQVFPLEKLFYSLEIDEGQFAFQSYARQMEAARKLSISKKKDAEKQQRIQDTKRKIGFVQKMMEQEKQIRISVDTDVEDDSAFQIRRNDTADKENKDAASECSGQNTEALSSNILNAVKNLREQTAEQPEPLAESGSASADEVAMCEALQTESVISRKDDIRASLDRINMDKMVNEMLHDEVDLSHIEGIFSYNDIMQRLRASRDARRQAIRDRLLKEQDEKEQAAGSETDKSRTDFAGLFGRKRAVQKLLQKLETASGKAEASGKAAETLSGEETQGVQGEDAQKRMVLASSSDDLQEKINDESETESEKAADQTSTANEGKTIQDVQAKIQRERLLLERLKASETQEMPEEEEKDDETPEELVSGEVHYKTEGTMLEKEPLYSHSSLVISGSKNYSRVLVMASAGHGKTTLLRRIALWYCHYGSAEKEHLNFQKKYSIEGKYLPCMIRLRDLSSHQHTLEDAIRQSVFEVLKTADNYREEDVVLWKQDTEMWIDSVRESLILLIDGLDELSDDMRYSFLKELETYLQKHPRTPVIMTSRAAGLLEERIVDTLTDLQFRGRSIIPLTDETAAEYSRLWIEETQPKDLHERLKDSVHQIMTQNKFYYLREFLRTPLELFLILKQVASGKLSLNRFQMFHDTLWEYFTGHVTEYSRKRFIFEDTMTFLGFLAYQMQLRNSMYISVAELAGLIDELKALSFHTDYIGSGHVEYCQVILDRLASNVGVIEKDIRSSEEVYTFPIRAYQEFLTAHACCHLCLTKNAFSPQPFEILSQKLNESRWLEVINFALYDLESNNPRIFDSLTQLVFEKSEDMEQLKTIVEGNMFVSRENAAALCRNAFRYTWLNHEQRELLAACMGTNSASSYVFALNASYRERAEAAAFLEADALSLVLWQCSVGQSPWQKAQAFLRSSSSLAMVRLGAMMIMEMTKSMMKETMKNYSAFISETFELTNELLMLLQHGARTWKDLICVSALTNLWLVSGERAEEVKAVLNDEMEEIVIQNIAQHQKLFRDLAIECVTDTRSVDFKTALQMVYTVGSFPLDPEKERQRRDRITDPFIVSYFHFLYDNFAPNKSFDRVALAKAQLRCDWDFETFSSAWTQDICEEIQFRFEKKFLVRERSRRHFTAEKAVMESIENSSEVSNVFPARLMIEDKSQLDIEECTNVFKYFYRGDYKSAADFCIRTLEMKTDSTRSNLAFLLRFAHLKCDDLTGHQVYSIPLLLFGDVVKNRPQALLNLALYEIEQGNYEEAKRLILQITGAGWKKTAEDFWYRYLWKNNKCAEGALVCVLSEKYGQQSFEEHGEMMRLVRQSYSAALLKTLGIGR